MARSPGDVSPKEQSKLGFRTSVYGTSSTTAFHTALVSQDYRPSYPKGMRGMVGSQRWVYPTSYSHHSRNIQCSGQAYIKQLVGGTLREVTVDTPDISSFLSVTKGINLSKAPLPPISGGMRNAATSKCLSKLSGQQASWGETFATFVQLRHMFGNKAKSLAELMTQFKKDPAFRNVRPSTLWNAAPDARVFSKAASAAYLEYVYGWKPLINDIAGTYELLRDYSQRLKPALLHARGSVSSEVQLSLDYKSLGWESNTFWVTGTCTEQRRVSCDIHARIKPDLALWRAINQLGLLNPVGILWDSTPFSFLVDWILPIGPVLSAMTAPIGLDFVSGSVSERISRTHQGEYHATAYKSSDGILKDTPLKFSGTDELYTRLALNGWPSVRLYLDSDPFRGDRTLKATALLIANLKL